MIMMLREWWEELLPKYQLRWKIIVTVLSCLFCLGAFAAIWRISQDWRVALEKGNIVLILQIAIMVVIFSLGQIWRKSDDADEDLGVGKRAKLSKRIIATFTIVLGFIALLAIYPSVAFGVWLAIIGVILAIKVWKDR
jgi:predicted RND superfamily exporter protein